MTTRPFNLTKQITQFQLRAAFEFKLQDCWIGAFWKRQGNCVDLWLCLLPCVPLHVSWWWHDPNQ
jgi:hypothetical protein